MFGIVLYLKSPLLQKRHQRCFSFTFLWNIFTWYSIWIGFLHTTDMTLVKSTQIRIRDNLKMLHNVGSCSTPQVLLKGWNWRRWLHFVKCHFLAWRPKLSPYFRSGLHSIHPYLNPSISKDCYRHTGHCKKTEEHPAWSRGYRVTKCHRYGRYICPGWDKVSENMLFC